MAPICPADSGFAMALVRQQFSLNSRERVYQAQRIDRVRRLRMAAVSKLAENWHNLHITGMPNWFIV
jgi:hypothetical protein